jgi:hypothetical protein
MFWQLLLKICALFRTCGAALKWLFQNYRGHVLTLLWVHDRDGPAPCQGEPYGVDYFDSRWHT